MLPRDHQKERGVNNMEADRVITSRQNTAIKKVAKIATSQKRRNLEGRAVIEGVHLCQSLLNSGSTPQLLIHTDSSEHDHEVQEIIRQSSLLRVETYVVSDEVFNMISRVENGVGVLFVVGIPHPTPPRVLQEDALLLDNVQDPGNVGTMLRTATAAGVATAYLSEGCASVWSPKVLRAGMGAHFAMTLYENCHLSTALENSAIPVYATDLKAEETVYELDLMGPTAWIFGNEGQGISPELLTQISKRVIIPQESDVESLNVAAATAICLFEQLRQRRIHTN